MPDEPHLFEYLTVAEHLRLMARLYSVEDFDNRARALTEELELTGKERSLPGELSRGMRQKVVIACGLVRTASTLLFDEPLTGLDPVGIRRMRQTIVARARAGACVLVSSHLLHMVEEICTRVIIMDRGRKIADGTVAELALRADLAAAGIESRADFHARHRPPGRCFELASTSRCARPRTACWCGCGGCASRGT